MKKFGNIVITEEGTDLFLAVMGNESTFIRLSTNVALQLLEDEPDIPASRDEVIEMFWIDDVLPYLQLFNATLSDTTDFYGWFMTGSAFAISVNMANS